MAKCIAVKMIGQHCEIAARADGVQFERKYGFNGYNNAWSKWAVLPSQFCINFDAANLENLPRYRLPDVEASYTRNTYYSTVLETSGLPCVTIYSVDDKYSDNNGAYQVAHGFDANGNFTQECNMYDATSCFKVTAILHEETKEENKMTYTTPELVKQAQEMIECVIAIKPEMKHVVLSKSDKATRAFFYNEKFAIIDSVTMKPIQSGDTIEIAQSNADAMNRHNIDNGQPGRYEVAIIDNV